MSDKSLLVEESRNMTFDDKLSDINKFVIMVGYCGSGIAAILYFVCKVMIAGGITSYSLLGANNLLKDSFESLLLGVVLVFGCVFFSQFVAFLMKKICFKN